MRHGARNSLIALRQNLGVSVQPTFRFATNKYRGESQRNRSRVMASPMYHLIVWNVAFLYEAPSAEIPLERMNLRVDVV